MFNIPIFNTPKDTIIDFQFGAYYASKVKGKYEVIRLLDLTGDSYHYQIIESSFTKMPTLEQVEKIKPFIRHVPMEILALIGKDMRLIGHHILSRDDLIGYAVYLESMSVDDEAINNHLDQLIRLSGNEPERMRLYLDNGEVFAEHL